MHALVIIVVGIVAIEWELKPRLDWTKEEHLYLWYNSGHHHRKGVRIF